MGLTVTILERGSFGNMNAVLGQVSFDSSYPTGGEALSNGDMGLSAMKFAIFEPTGGYVFRYDRSNSKLLAYRQKDPANAGGADIPLPEVGNTVDLSALTGVGFMAIGF